MEELQQEVKELKEKVAKLERLFGILKRDYQFDIGRVFEEIDKLNGIEISEDKNEESK